MGLGENLFRKFEIEAFNFSKTMSRQKKRPHLAVRPLALTELLRFAD
jgi:hypothetical protein